MNFANHFNKITMPMMKEDLTSVGVNTEHPNYIAIPFHMKGVITGEGRNV
jgi:hypothetical protein